MKTQLTKEESQHLIDLGIPKEMARCELPIGDGVNVFSLTDLLEILPEEIETNKTYPLRMESWLVGWMPIWDVQYVGMEESFFSNKELIDSLYQLACWYHGEYLESEDI